MQWSPQQDEALGKFSRWYKGGGRGIFRLFGYAGTGKSTLAMELSNVATGQVHFAAFTGKAASVMRKRGCGGATTLHSLIYNTSKNSRKHLVDLEQVYAEEEDEQKRMKLLAEITAERQRLAQPKFSLNPDADVRRAALIVVDEVSMVDARLGQDLMSFGRPVLALGDPAQLPPVKGTGFFQSDNPEVMLTEVHRVALDNPITRLATMVRNQESLEYGDYGDSRVVRREELAGPEASQADQVLVGRNLTREDANNRIRMRLGYREPLPMPGEKLVCLRNNHDLGLLNGTIFRVVKAEDAGETLLLSVRPEEGGEPIDVIAYKEPFVGQPTPRWSASEGLEEFTYGYALTVHKAQGSEWDNVFVVDESSAFRADRHKWLYTAVTRASKTITVVR